MNKKKIRNKTRTMQFPKGKPSLQFSANWLEYKIKGLEEEYNKLAQQYAYFVKEGIALKNIHVLDTLRSLTFLYTDIAAHKHALRSLKTEF
jgi:flagellar biosynthesis chaperone FliJ